MKPDQKTKDDILRLSHLGWQFNDIAFILDLSKRVVKKVLSNPDAW